MSKKKNSVALKKNEKKKVTVTVPPQQENSEGSSRGGVRRGLKSPKAVSKTEALQNDLLLGTTLLELAEGRWPNQKVANLNELCNLMHTYANKYSALSYITTLLYKPYSWHMSYGNEDTDDYTKNYFDIQELKVPKGKELDVAFKNEDGDWYFYTEVPVTIVLSHQVTHDTEPNNPLLRGFLKDLVTIFKKAGKYKDIDVTSTSDRIAISVTTRVIKLVPDEFCTSKDAAGRKRTMILDHNGNPVLDGDGNPLFDVSSEGEEDDGDDIEDISSMDEDEDDDDDEEDEYEDVSDA